MLPLEVLEWERIEFRRGVGFGMEIQPPDTELERGVANAAAFLSEIQNYRQKNEFPGAQRRLWRDLQPHSAL